MISVYYLAVVLGVSRCWKWIMVSKEGIISGQVISALKPLHVIVGIHKQKCLYFMVVFHVGLWSHQSEAVVTLWIWRGCWVLPWFICRHHLCVFIPMLHVLTHVISTWVMTINIILPGNTLIYVIFHETIWPQILIPRFRILVIHS